MVRNTSDAEFQESLILNTPENQELSCSTLLFTLEIIIEEDEDSEVVKPKKERKPQQIYDLDDEDVEEDYSEVIKPKAKRKPQLIEDSEIELGIIVEK